jgi:hypothetical protein
MTEVRVVPPGKAKYNVRRMTMIATTTIIARALTARPLS